jgi:hypothetical protein
MNTKELTFVDLIQRFDAIKNYPHLQEDNYVKKDYWIVQLNEKWGVIDVYGNSISDFKYDEILDFEGFFAKVRINYKWGFIDKTGHEIGEIKYHQVYSFVDKRARVMVDSFLDWENDDEEEDIPDLLDIEYWGFIDENGVEITLNFDYAEDFACGYAVVGKKTGESLIYPNDKDRILEVYYYKYYGYINLSGEEITKINYTSATSFHNGVARTYLDGIWNFIDREFNVIATFSDNAEIEEIDTNTLFITQKEKCGLIDEFGRKITELKYELIDKFSEGFAVVKLLGRYGFINKVGKEITDLKFEDADEFIDSVAKVKLSGKYGLLDFSGTEILPICYDEVDRMVGSRLFYDDGGVGNQNVFIAFDKGVSRLFRKDKQKIIEIAKDFEKVKSIYEYCFEVDGEYKKSTDFFILNTNNGIKLINVNGHIISDGVYSFIENRLYGKMFCVHVNEKAGLINCKGEIVLEVKYDEIRDCTNGYIVKLENKYGLMNISGEIVIEIKYDEIRESLNGYIVKLGGKEGFFNSAGNELLTTEYDEIYIKQEYLNNQGFVIYRMGEKFGAFNLSKKSIIPAKYDELEIFNNELLVASKNKNIGIIDFHNNEYVKTEFKSYDQLSNRYLVFYSEDFRFYFFDLTSKSLLPQSVFPEENDSSKIYKLKTAKGWKYFNHIGDTISKRTFEVASDDINGYAFVKWNEDLGIIVFENPDFFKKIETTLSGDIIVYFNYGISVYEDKIHLLTQENINNLHAEAEELARENQDLINEVMQEEAEWKSNIYPTSGDHTCIDGEWIHNDAWTHD